jgi:hypothetical protein
VGDVDVGIVAIGGVLVTWQQKNVADRRSEWWRRVTWALERTFNADDTEAALGLEDARYAAAI